MNLTIDGKSIISANNLHESHTYGDSYYTVHMYMREYAGGVSNFSIGVVKAKSSKHKMNLIGSNKSEVI